MSPTHEWTKFEESTLLALMVKGVHITNLDPKAETSKKKKYMDIATALNTACHKGQYADDIPWKAVADKVEHWIKTKKAGVALMDRHRVGHVTRTMKRVWNRGIKFDGTMREWEEGRKDTAHLESKTGAGSDGWDNNPVATVENGEQTDNGWGDAVQETTSSEAANNIDDVWDTQIATTAPTSCTDDPWVTPVTLAPQETALDPWGTATNSKAHASMATVASADLWGTASSKETQTHTTAKLTGAVDDSWGTQASQIPATNLWDTVSNTEAQGPTISGPTDPINNSWGATGTTVSQANTLDTWGSTTSNEAQISTAIASLLDPWGAISDDPVQAPTENAVSTGAEASTTIGNFPDPWARIESPDPFDYNPGVATSNPGATDVIAAYSTTLRKSIVSKASTATIRTGKQWCSTSTIASTVWNEENRSIQPITLAFNTDTWDTNRSRQAGPPANIDPWRKWDEPVSPKAIPQHEDINTLTTDLYSAQPDDLWAMSSASSASITGNMETMPRKFSENHHQQRASKPSRPATQDLGCTTVAGGMNPERLRMLSEIYSVPDIENLENTVGDLAENDGAAPGFKICGSNMIPLSFNRLSGGHAKVIAKDVHELEGNDAMDLNE